MDARSAEEGLKDWTRYAGPHGPDYSAQVFLMELQANAAGQTAAMLKSPDGNEGALLEFNINDLPHMSLWKNETPLGTGYVTGLEPGTGFPYLRSVERPAAGAAAESARDLSRSSGDFGAADEGRGVGRGSGHRGASGRRTGHPEDAPCGP